MKRKAVSGIILTMLLIGILPSVFDIQPVEANPSTIIVPDDYEKIQWAIGNASNGDTIFVRAGTYYEHIEITKPLILTGQYNQTILKATGDGGVHILTSNVTLTGFKITYDTPHRVLVLVDGRDTPAFNNIIKGNILISEGSGTDSMALVKTKNNKILDNVISNDQNGVCIAMWDPVYEDVVNNNIVSNNTLIGGCISVYCSDSDNNTIVNNVILNQTAVEPYCGAIYLYSSANNVICHNSFLSNELQAYVYANSLNNKWDDGYPSGGNYWSDYTGVDDKSGPNQDQPDSDGIGDTPYIINGNNQDDYPLMNPWNPTEINVDVNGTDYPVTIVSNSTITNFNFSYSLQKLGFEVTGPSNTTGYCNLILPEDLINGTIAVLVNGFATPYNIEENTTHFFIYFTYSHSTSFIETLATILGDVDGDRDVDVGDQRKMQLAMFSVPGDPNWNLYADVDCDEDVDVGDQRKQQLNMFESW